MEDWYVAGVNALTRQQEQSRAQAQATAEESLRASGAGEGMEDYDLASMSASGVPLDGTTANEHAKPGRKFLDRFDARDGTEVMPSRFGPTQAAAEEIGRTAITIPYEFGRGIVNFAGDVAEWAGEDPEKVLRPPSAEDLGFAPEYLPGQIVATVSPFLLGWQQAYSRLGALRATPRSAFGRVTGATPRAVVAGAGADVLLSDPRHDSLYNMFREGMGAENEVARAIDPALLYEQDPMLGRAAMAFEGAAVGAVGAAALVGGGSAAAAGGKRVAQAAAQFWQGADDVERLAVEALAKSRSQLNAGIPPEDVGWLAVWMGAKMMKGVQTLNTAMREKLGDLGATADQVDEAWANANELHRMAAEDNAARMAARPEFVQALEDQAAHFVVPEVAGETLPPEMAAKTAVNFFSEQEPGRTTKRFIGEDIQSQAREMSPDILDATPENAETFTKLIAADVKTAIGRSGDEAGGNWYRSHTARAQRLAGLKYPEIVDDPAQTSAFNFALAITSQGERVSQNGKNAMKVYEHFRETGRFPEDFVGGGKSQPTMREAFGTYNDLVDTFGVDQTRRFMDMDFTVKELKDAGFTISGESTKATVKGSVIFGPKIGGAFYQNLNGNLSPLTMDMWWRRTWGRYSGAVMVKPERIDKILDMVTGGFYDPKKKVNLPPLDAKQAKYWGIPGPRAWKKLDREGKIEAMKKVFSHFSTGTAPGGPGKGSGTFLEKESGIAKTARSLHMSLGPVETMTATERTYMRDRVHEAAGLLQKEGIEVEPADIQALLWYLEKDVYAARGQRVERVAFDDPFIDWAREQGYTADEIQGAIRGRRASSAGGPRGDDDAARAAAGGRQEADGPGREAFLAFAGAGA